LRHRSAEIAKVVSEVLRALSICVPVALVDAPAAQAQAIARATLPADIPAQPLPQALGEFARHTGLQLVYVSSVVRDKKSHAVSAGLGVNEGLTRLLKGTGLRFEYLTPDTIDILAAAPPERRTQTPPEGEPLQVIVTASRREELLQDVPITIQAITGDQLTELNVLTFNDLLKYTTNITYSGNGPGTGSIFIRGLGSYGSGNQEQSTGAPFPNVALYLDDQAMQFPGRNNDVYLVDLERVEVLEGPQGTLFGGGAEAGAIRYITNKPKLDVTSGELNAGYGVTANGGDPNTQLNAVLNIPLISNTLAVRAVIFAERQGGYIDNVPGTISFDKYSYQDVRLTSPVVNNADLVRSNTNPVTYGGLRLSGLYQFNDDWDLLIQQSYQNMHADGYFYAYPFDSNGNPLQPYEITAFTPAYTKDRYESTAWTLNGRFGDMKAVYAGSYMVRHIEGQQDYSNYVSSSYNGSYYDCIGPNGPFSGSAGKPLTCYPPVANWHDSVQNEHQSHEVRVSTSEQHRVRALVGAYWEKFVIDDQMNWNYLGIPQCDPSNLAKAEAGGPDCLAAVGPVPGSWASDPHLRENMNNAFGEDVQRGYKQYAFFASVDFDIIPKVLTVTAGTRRYHYDEFEEGSVWYTGGSPLILDHPNGACTAAQACGYPLSLAKSESGFRSRASLTWHITPDVMTYYTFSQGFRPGGFNRTSPGLFAALPYCTPVFDPPPPDPRCRIGGSLYNLFTKFNLTTDQYAKPQGFQSDNLISNELGLKSEFLNHRVLVNASAYRMNWNDVQLLLYDPLNSLGVIVNGANYTIDGVELQLAARLTEQLIVQGSSSWNSSNQTSAPCLRSAGAMSSPINPTPAGQCITVVQQHPYNNPFGSLNSSLPFSPPRLFNVRARYDWAAGPYKPFAWVGASHFGPMHNEPANFPDGNGTEHISPLFRYTIPAYTTYDAAIGVSRDNWTVQLTGSNLTNVYGPTNMSSAQFIRSETPLRPRVLMANFAYRF
jgi:outer membrane receptor protein involved in Fe transport